MISATRDSISLREAGVVTITQPKNGFRFTQDSLLLADFCRIRPRDRVLEPGAGAGIISLLLAKKFPQAKLTAVELNPDAAELCRRNIIDNDLDDRITVLERDISDLKKPLLAQSFDVIVVNPPYTRSGSGRKSPLSGRQLARHDEAADIKKWIDLQKLLKNRGRYFIVFPAGRTAELFSLMKACGLEPKRIRFVHPFTNKPAALCLIESVKSAGVGVEVVPPLIVHGDDGDCSAEMRKIYAADT